MGGSTLEPGERVLLLDGQGNSHDLRLQEGATFHHHRGAIVHDDLIGVREGSLVRTSTGRAVVVVRPRQMDAILSMPRKSGIVYPKDAALLVTWADIRPGHRVLESGIGSGALTLALLRAVGPGGQVIGYEQRADFLDLALSNVRAFGDPDVGNLLLRERDVYTGLVDGDLDRVVLDLPEPWHVVQHLPGHLKQGGWVCAYNPSVVQVMQLTDALLAARSFVQVESLEVLVRPWHVRGSAVRPLQQMVGHTGFITVARLVEPGAGWGAELDVNIPRKRRQV